MRVLITGIGPVCAHGSDARTVWANLLVGRNAVGPVARLAGAPVTFGAEVPGFSGAGVLDPREEACDLAMQFVIVATHRALADAGLLDAGRSAFEAPRSAPAARCGAIVGTSRGAAALLESSHIDFLTRGAKMVGRRVSPLTTPGNLSGAVSKHFGLRGPACTVSAACASGAQAIGLGLDLIRAGRADLVVAGGTEACLTPFTMAMFVSTGILSRRTGDPARAARPFDRDRDGIVLGEGAAMVVLESEASARARGARAYCELRGWGASSDAHSLTAVPPDGEGLVRAIGLALADAGVAADDVDYVHAHGTGTRSGDPAETVAIKAALGPRARAVPVSSTKSMTGHLIGAAGGLGALVCAFAIAEGAVPPTLNLENPDPACDLDYVADGARRRPVRVALSNAMGFGGNNAALVFGALP
jgi:3-oxoacyl-[acyl-carrier-protein] synthase II